MAWFRWPRIPLFVGVLVPVLSFVFALSTYARSPEQGSSVGDSSRVVNLVQSDEGLSFTLDVAPPQLSAEGVLAVDGLFGTTTEIGAPAIPYYSTLIALPPMADVQVAVRVGDVEVISAEQVRPVPSADLPTDGKELSKITSLEKEGLQYLPNQAIYAEDALYPHALYTVSEPMYLRDLRVVQLSLYPVRYNPAQAQINYTDQINISIQFDGAQPSSNPAPEIDSDGQTARSLVLNDQFPNSWRDLPRTTAAPTTFPIGVDTLKIAVEKSGIYKVTYADMQSAGLAVGSINPNNIQMSHRGQPVSYKFVGNNDNTFSNDEYILFYGKEFNCSINDASCRYEKMYVTAHYYWLWVSNSAGTRLTTASNPTGYTAVTTFPSTIKFEEDNYFRALYTNDLTPFQTAPDGWYHFEMGFTSGAPYTMPLTTPHRADSGPNFDYSLELWSRNNTPHNVIMTLNDHPSALLANWEGAGAQVLFTNNRPLGELNSGVNIAQLSVKSKNDAGQDLPTEKVMLNSVSITYTRKLIADNNQLLFNYAPAGNYEFQVSGFSTGSDGVVWDITNPLIPVEIPVSGRTTGTAPNITYHIGRTNPSNGRYIATTLSNAQSPVSIVKYRATSLEPTNGGTDWLAITHPDFLTETNRLANHRRNFSGYQAHVVTLEDVVNQYGYGYTTPAAVTAYLQHAMADWSRKPSYFVIVGDTTQTPMRPQCSTTIIGQCTFETSYSVVDLRPVDRFLGIAPSDYYFATVVGTDALPDLAVGRFAVETANQMKSMVDKVIRYDTEMRNKKAWAYKSVFMADDTDAGGDFCAQITQLSSTRVPSFFTRETLCLDKFISQYPSVGEAKANLRATLLNGPAASVNVTGVAFVNYRGHGAIGNWATDLMNESTISEWANPGLPPMIISADCLDGHFAWTGQPALSETYLELDNERGSAAHWSSTGLGYSFEHSHLVNNLYDAFYNIIPYDHNQNDSSRARILQIGSAINFSKTRFIQHALGDVSEAYTFTLQGDPAMKIAETSYRIYLPLTIKP